MVPRLLTRLGVEYIIVADVLLVALLFAGMGRVLAVTVALLLAQVLTAARVGMALRFNPVKRSFLDSYTNSTALVRTVKGDKTGGNVRPEVVAFFSKYNMSRAGSIEVVTEVGTSWSHVFVSPDAYVLGAMRSGSPHPMIVSRLSDGRFLATTPQLVPPHESLVVNNVRHGDAHQLLETHVALLERLQGEGVSPVASDEEAIASILGAEHAAWRQLGPYLGSFLAIGTRWRPLLLHTRIPADTILQRGLDSTISIATTDSVITASTLPAVSNSPTESAEAFPWHEAS